MRKSVWKLWAAGFPVALCCVRSSINQNTGKEFAMLLISNIMTPPGSGDEAAVEKALSKLGIKPGGIKEAYVYKSSLDARRRGEIHIVSTVAIRLSGDEKRLASHPPRGVSLQYRPDEDFTIQKGNKPCSTPVVVAGFGPAGIFAAGLLAREGYRVIVLERGGAMDERVKAVESFWSRGELDTQCNVQFGEGGAGTFSDGKLTTRINDPLCRYVLDRFAEHGAPAETLRRAKPHIGTDLLRGVCLLDAGRNHPQWRRNTLSFLPDRIGYP